MPNGNVKFRYASHANITFHGEIDSGYSREDWSEMDDNARDEALSEALANLVDIYAVEDD